jgi:hypothetical protein
MPGLLQTKFTTKERVDKPNRQRVLLDQIRGREGSLRQLIAGTAQNGRLAVSYIIKRRKWNQ